MTQELLLNEFKKYDYLNENERPLVKIFVGYIKPSFLFKSEILTPIHLGRSVAKENSKDGIISNEELDWLYKNCLGDNDFEGNISQYNRRIGFLTGTYYAYKNYERIGNPEYFGFFGYRKLLVPDCLNNLKDYDIVIPETEDWVKESNKINFISAHSMNLFNYMCNALARLHPDEVKGFKEYMDMETGYYHEMYIMKKKLFFEYCEWIFPILSYLLEQEGCMYIPDNRTLLSSQKFVYDGNEQRDLAFIIEYLTGYYLYKKSLDKSLKCKICPMVKFFKVDKEKMKTKIFNFLRENYKNNQKNKIPKRIFYVWGENEPLSPKSQKCIATWMEKLSDYEIIKIHENSKEYFDFQNELKNNRWFRTVYERKMWAYVSDYIRVKVLYDNGGIYLDTDVVVEKDFAPLLDEQAFVGLTNLKMTEPAVLGARKENKFLEKVINFYNEEIWHSSLYTIPRIFQKLILDEQNKMAETLRGGVQMIQDPVKLKDITIFPQRYFVPIDMQGSDFDRKCITEDTYAIHWGNGSWIKPEMIYFLEKKHLMPVEEIDKSYQQNKDMFIRLINLINKTNVEGCNSKVKKYFNSVS